MGVNVSAGCVTLLFQIWTLNLDGNPLGWKQADDRTNQLSVFLQMSVRNRQYNNGRADEMQLSFRQNNVAPISLVTAVYWLLACMGMPSSLTLTL